MAKTTRIGRRTADVGGSHRVQRALEAVRRVTVSPLRAGVLALPVLLGAAALAPVGATASGSATSPEFFGTNFSTLSSIPSANRAWGTGKQAVTFDALRDSRMTLNRIDVYWNQVQGTENGGYTWGNLDALIGAMAAKGLRASPLFRFPPAWAGDGIPNRLVPDHYDDFGRFVAAFAKRYGPVVNVGGRLEGAEFWTARKDLTPRPVLTYELWNEVNLDEYAWSTDADTDGDADPAAYAAMLKVAVPIIKATLPSAVVLGSLSWKDRPEEAGTDKMVPLYAPKLQAAGGLALLDGMGFHPYAPDAQATIDLVIRLRQQLAASGFPQMPIYADEAGQEAITVDPSNGATAPTDRSPAKWGYDRFPTDASRAANLAFAGEALAASDCGVKQFLPYGVSGPFSSTFAAGTKDLPRTEAWMGLYFNTTGQPTLSAQALQRASQRWAARFDAGGPGAPAPLALCGGGESPAASKLPIEGAFTGLPDGCVKVVTTYDGNPLESAYLRFYDPATGQQVAEARTDTRGEAAQCVPWNLKGKAFRVVANIGQAGTTGTVDCDVPGVGCPVGVELRPGAGALSARAATNFIDAPIATGQAGSAPRTTPCTYKLTLAPGKFTKDKRGSRGRQRLTASLTCNTSTRGTKVRFQILRRAAKGGKERLVKRVTLAVGKPRVLGVPAMKKGERVVVLHAAEPTIGIPRLRQSLRVGAKVQTSVKTRH